MGKKAFISRQKSDVLLFYSPGESEIGERGRYFKDIFLRLNDFLRQERAFTAGSGNKESVTRPDFGREPVLRHVQ